MPFYNQSTQDLGPISDIQEAAKLINGINAASYLDCKEKLTELLIIFYFNPKKDLTLLNDDLLYQYNKLKIADNMRDSFIANDIFTKYLEMSKYNLIIACKYGSIRIFQWIKSQNFDMNIHRDEMFLTACKNNQLEILKLLYMDNIDNNFEGFNMFYTACHYEYLEIAQWLFENNKHIGNIRKAFRSACIYDKVIIAQWLITLIEVDRLSIQNDFITACRNNSLNIIRWLHQKITISDINDLFNHPCVCNSIEVAKLLYSFGGIDLHIGNERFFIIVCSEGYFEFAKWLYDTSIIEGNVINIHAEDDYVFEHVCQSDKNFDLVLWLYNLGGIDIHMNRDNIFKIACITGQTKIAKWLYSIDGININFDKDKIFRLSCENGYYDIPRWLYSLGDIKVDIGLFKMLCRCGNVVMLDWIYHLNEGTSEDINLFEIEYINVYDNNVIRWFKRTIDPNYIDIENID